MEKQNIGWLEKITVTVYAILVFGGILWGTYLLIRNIIRILIK
jgi:hypothetical protein